MGITSTGTKTQSQAGPRGHNSKQLWLLWWENGLHWFVSDYEMHTLQSYSYQEVDGTCPNIFCTAHLQDIRKQCREPVYSELSPLTWLFSTDVGVLWLKADNDLCPTLNFFLLFFTTCPLERMFFCISRRWMTCWSSAWSWASCLFSSLNRSASSWYSAYCSCLILAACSSDFSWACWERSSQTTEVCHELCEIFLLLHLQHVECSPAGNCECQTCLHSRNSFTHDGWEYMPNLGLQRLVLEYLYITTKPY